MAQQGSQRCDLRKIPSRNSLKYTDKYSKARLSSLRLLGDPAADEVVEHLYKQNGQLTKIHDLLATVRMQAAAESTSGGGVCARFLDNSASIPAWANKQQIERGQQIHAAHTPFMALSLFAGSLVGGGQFITASVVTALAGNISNDPTRRVNETGLLLAAIGFPGSLLTADGEAHQSLTRVRLLHAALRHWLPRSGRLQPHRSMVPSKVYVEGEVPINQHDLAITLGIFAYLNVRSLTRMGIFLSRTDIDAYIHMWRYAGHVLGIADNLLPVSLEDQEEFMLASMLHQGSPESMKEAGTKKFIDAFAKSGAAATGIGFGVLQTYLYQMVRYLNGAEFITGTNIPDLGDWHWAPLLTWFFGVILGTLVPMVPFGERALVRLHTRRLRNRLEKRKARGTPLGHAPGTGKELARHHVKSEEVQTNIGEIPPRAALSKL